MRFLFYIFLGILGGLALERSASAQGDYTRITLQDFLNTQNDKIEAFFQSAPIAHIIPRRNTIFFAGALENFDLVH